MELLHEEIGSTGLSLIKHQSVMLDWVRNAEPVIFVIMHSWSQSSQYDVLHLVWWTFCSTHCIHPAIFLFSNPSSLLTLGTLLFYSRCPVVWIHPWFHVYWYYHPNAFIFKSNSIFIQLLLWMCWVGWNHSHYELLQTGSAKVGHRVDMLSHKLRKYFIVSSWRFTVERHPWSSTDTMSWWTHYVTTLMIDWWTAYRLRMILHQQGERWGDPCNPAKVQLVHKWSTFHFTINIFRCLDTMSSFLWMRSYTDWVQHDPQRSCTRNEPNVAWWPMARDSVSSKAYMNRRILTSSEHNPSSRDKGFLVLIHCRYRALVKKWNLIEYRTASCCSQIQSRNVP